MKLGHAVIVNLLTGLLGRVISSFSPLFLLPVMLRYWGLELYGEWLIVSAYSSYMMISPELGIGHAAIMKIAAEGEHKPSETEQLFRSARQLLPFLAFTFLIAGTLLARHIDWQAFGVHALTVWNVVEILAWTGSSVVVGQQCYVYSAVYRAKGLNPNYGLIQSFGSFLEIAAGISVLLFGASPANYARTIFCVKFIILCVVEIYARKIGGEFFANTNRVRMSQKLSALAGLLRPAIGHAGLPLLSVLQNQGMVTLVGAMLGPAAAGTFQTVRVLSNSVRGLITLVGLSIALEIPRLLGSGRVETAIRLAIRSSQALLIATILFCCLWAVIGRTVYAVWVGIRTYPNGLVQILLLSVMPFTVYSSASLLLASANFVHRTLLPLIAAAFASVVLGMALISTTGLVGVGFAVLAWESSAAALTVFAVHTHFNVTLRTLSSEFWSISGIISDTDNIREELFVRIKGMVKNSM
jgi:O-antigen/teichoic acid export membrane protein